MIDIAPPLNEVPKKIPPRELIKQKIAESQISEEGSARENLSQIPSLSDKTAKPSSKSLLPEVKPKAGKSGIGIILGLVFVFLLVIISFVVIGAVYTQSNSLNNKVNQLNQAIQTEPQDLATQKTKLETLEKDLNNLKKTEADKIKSLEDKLNKISPQGYADKADKKSVEKLETILKTTDTDKDGLTDYEEVILYKSNPNVKDSDGDGFSDKIEVDKGYNPAGPGKLEKIPQEEETSTTISEVIQVKAYKYAFDPAKIKAKVGEKIKLEITSLDIEHTFTIDELNVNQKISAGGTAVIEFTPDKAGEYTYYSNILEDKGKGMAGKIAVE